jgi:hypothetical protein
MALHEPGYFERESLRPWERFREALRRDWEQTLHDFSSHAGRELNQSLTDTVKQVVGAEPIPPSGRPNPRRIIARWVP